MSVDPLTRTRCACQDPDPIMQADGRSYCYICSFWVPAVICPRCQGIAPIMPAPKTDVLTPEEIQRIREAIDYFKRQI